MVWMRLQNIVKVAPIRGMVIIRRQLIRAVNEMEIGKNEI